MVGPDEIRALLGGARQHPARAIACPHCHAAPHIACTTPGRGRRMTGLHPARITAWTTRSTP